MTESNDLLSRHFDKSDLDRLSQVQVAVSGSRSVSLGDLLVAWSGHVEKIESDLVLPDDDRSVWGAHDLIAALYIRDRIQEGTAGLDARLRKNVDEFVSGADERFLSLTEADEQGSAEAVDGRTDAGRGWWWKRIPKAGPIHSELVQYYGHVHVPQS